MFQEILQGGGGGEKDYSEEDITNIWTEPTSTNRNYIAPKNGVIKIETSIASLTNLYTCLITTKDANNNTLTLSSSLKGVASIIFNCKEGQSFVIKRGSTAYTNWKVTLYTAKE